MAYGIVKWFNVLKGYGFIVPEDGSHDVFVHVSALDRAGLTVLQEGQRVEYDLTTNKDKICADNLRVKSEELA